MKIHISEIMIISFAVEFLLYAPISPMVDLSVVFLWIMSVGTLITASLWQEFDISEQADERYNELSKVNLILFSIRYYVV